MFTLYEVEDDRLIVRSADPGDIARVFRLLHYDLPLPTGTRINSVYVTILREDLTGQINSTNINEPRPEPPDDQAELFSKI